MNGATGPRVQSNMEIWISLWSYWTEVAVIHGDLDIIMELLDRGCSQTWRFGHHYGATGPSVQSNMEIWTPLWSYWTEGAVMHGDLDTIMELLDRGCSHTWRFGYHYGANEIRCSQTWRFGHHYGAPESKVQSNMEI
jgi:hypothetical protein